MKLSKAGDVDLKMEMILETIKQTKRNAEITKKSYVTLVTPEFKKECEEFFSKYIKESKE